MRYVAIRSEGGLVPYDLLDKISSDQAAGQKPADFGLPKGQRLIDEVSRVWADAQNLWSNFKRRRQSLTERDPYGTSITRSWIVSLLADREMLGFDLKLQTSAVVVNNVTFAISHRNGDDDGAIPVHIEGCKIDLDRRLHTKLRTSPQAMLQDFLNNSEECSWGILTNGVTLRLLRDSSRTSKPTYLEFDLESVLEGNRFNEFALLYRLCHRTRFPQPGHEASDCLLEHYYQESLDEGARVRERLRDGVEDALKVLGTALLRHPGNASLREKSATKEFWPQYHRQLLLLVYRLLFLMVAEERGLIISLGDNSEHNQKIYDEWYSIARLRDRASQIIEESPFGDLWQGLHRTFSLFEYGLDSNPLGIPPLNGDLFDQKRAMPDLAGTELYNHELLLALRRLSIFKDEKGGPWIRVNYSHLDVEELGSVYESLLDYQPVIQKVNGGLAFELSPGVERKKTGSYYTRPELVHELIESALVPVMQQQLGRAEKETEGKDLITEQKAKEKALLDMSVCDPACGSGHFLLAAARRLGKELARVRTGEDEPKPTEFHLAVRDVISHCIYGVDLNPLAVDLCKVALWLEGHWAGKPLSFLDHRIRCGNSLIGIRNAEVLEDGIPDDAFTAVTGDDKKVAAFFKKRNKQERTSRQRALAFEADDHTGEYAASNRELRELTENTAADVRKKAQMYSGWRAGMQHSHDEAVADLWTAQFFLPLTSTSDPAICSTKDFLEFAVDKQKKPQQVAAAQQMAQRIRFFHWHLEFPDVMSSGGFDVVLGNPPWDMVQLDPQEFFAVSAPAIAHAANLNARQKLIEQLRTIDPQLASEYDFARHAMDAEQKFVHDSGRFPFTSFGRLNLAPLFTELGRHLVSPFGKCGLIVPVGIATDSFTQHFFSDILNAGSLDRLIGYENESFIFPAVANVVRFCTLVLNGSKLKQDSPEFAFLIRYFAQLTETDRFFRLSKDQIRLLNPNTNTCPIFRSKADAQLTTKLYSAFGVLVDETRNHDQWGFSGLLMFMMNTDSFRFRTQAGSDLLPLYEGKMFWQFDHRFGSYEFEERTTGRGLADTPIRCYEDIDYEPQPRYWVPSSDVEERLSTRWTKNWLMVFRDVTSSKLLRTSVFAILPRVAVGHKAPLVFLNQDFTKVAMFLANANSIPFDYVARQKIGGTSLSFFILKQLPFLPPDGFSAADACFIVPRVLSLVYTARSLKPFFLDVWNDSDEHLRSSIIAYWQNACGMGLDSDNPQPAPWNEAQRSAVMAQLDAYFAHLYKLTLTELQFVLDPADVFGSNYPSETFRVLRENEQEQYGEYRTRRLVLEAYDELAKSDRFRNEMAKRVSAIEIPEGKATAGVIAEVAP